MIGLKVSSATMKRPSKCTCRYWDLWGQESNGKSLSTMYITLNEYEEQKRTERDKKLESPRRVQAAGEPVHVSDTSYLHLEREVSRRSVLIPSHSRHIPKGRGWLYRCWMKEFEQSSLKARCLGGIKGKGAQIWRGIDQVGIQIKGEGDGTAA